MDLIVEQWPIGKLIPYARNPRKNEHAVTDMMSVIREFGFRIPIVAMSDGTVVDGHLRLKAALRLGLETVPVALADELTPEQIKAFRLLANRSATWAEWDDGLLRIEMADLNSDGFNLEMTGFRLDELTALLGQPGAPGPNPGDEARAKLADRFGVPPFTVLSARDGWWQDRKRAWLALGIQSELGRGEVKQNGAAA